MRKLLACVVVLMIMSIFGCGNLSPRSQLREEIQNQNGTIDEIESNQHNLKNELEVQGSELDRIQNGLLNDQNNNSGFQILSGSGGLYLGLVGVLTIFVVVTMHYRQQAATAEKAADIMAESIVARSDSSLEDNIFKAAMHSSVEEKVFALVQKHQRKKNS